MTERWRLILHGKSDGATNMAVDQAIFRSVESGRSPTTLRFYGWSPPTISLGYAQPVEILDIERCRELGVGVVRRPTGGKAVFHDAEVTYSLSSPIPSPVFPHTLKGNCMIINSCITRGLAGLRTGPGIHFFPTPLGGRERGEGNSNGHQPRVACFEEPSLYEIVVDGRKLAGSAQRRSDRAFLHHGAIPLVIQWTILSRLFRNGLCPPVPKAAGLRECLGRDIDNSEVIEALVKGFSEALGIVCEPGTLTEEEEEVADGHRKSALIDPSAALRINSL